MSDGVIKSEFIIRTKMGEQYKVVGYDSREEMTTKLTEALIEKKPLVFPSKDENGKIFDQIIPHDTVYDIKIWDFSHLSVTKSKVIAPNVQ